VLFKFRYCTSVRGFEKQTITKLARIGVGKSAGRNGYITSYAKTLNSPCMRQLVLTIAGRKVMF
jgi:hypothetical protein